MEYCAGDTYHTKQIQTSIPLWLFCLPFFNYKTLFLEKQANDIEFLCVD